MMDRRLLGLVPGAMRHVAATVAWQWVGLAGSVALAWGVSLPLAALLAGRPASAEAPASAALVALAGRCARSRPVLPRARASPRRRT